MKITAFNMFNNNVSSEEVFENSIKLGLNKRIQKKHEEKTIEGEAEDIAILSPEEFAEQVEKRFIEMLSKPKMDYEDFYLKDPAMAVDTTSLNDERTPSYLYIFRGKRYSNYNLYRIRVAIYKEKNAFSYGLTILEKSIEGIELGGYDPRNARPLTMTELENAIRVIEDKLNYWTPIYRKRYNLEESSLGLNKRVQKKYTEKTAEDFVGKMFIQNEDDFKLFVKNLFNDEFKNDDAKHLRFSKDWSGFNTASLTFNDYTDMTGHYFSPRLLILFKEDNEEVVTSIDLDFRTDTAGSGALNSRKISVCKAFNTEESVVNVSNCIKNIKKIAGKEPSFYPGQYAKKSYANLVNGFEKEDYIPSTKNVDNNYVTKDEMIKWMTLPRYYSDKGFDFMKAFNDLYGYDLTYIVNMIKDFKNMSDQEFIDYVTSEYLYKGYLASGKVKPSDFLKKKKACVRYSNQLYGVSVQDGYKNEFVMHVVPYDKEKEEIYDACYIEGAYRYYLEDVTPDQVQQDLFKYRHAADFLWKTREGQKPFDLIADHFMAWFTREKRSKRGKAAVKMIKESIKDL